MRQLHTRVYEAVAEHYPELGLKARLAIAADSVEANVKEAADMLGYENWTLDYDDVLNHPTSTSSPSARRTSCTRRWPSRRPRRQAVLDRNADGTQCPGER